MGNQTEHQDGVHAGTKRREGEREEKDKKPSVDRKSVETLQDLPSH